MESLKRVVAGPASYRIEDSCPSAVEIAQVTGLSLADVWRTSGLPIDNAGKSDKSTEGNFAVAPACDGTLFRVITFPPKSVLDNVPADVMASLGVETPAGVDTNLMWHQTDTIDYITIVSGTIELNTQEGSYRLNCGDVAVVRGILHAWSNPEEVECVMSCVSIGAKKSPPA